MEFDKSKVYTAINADELKVGSKVVGAYAVGNLKTTICEITNSEEEEQYGEITNSEEEEQYGKPTIGELIEILNADYQNRFRVRCGNSRQCWTLVYLLEEPQEQQLKWTDLKIGDVVRSSSTTSMVVAIDNYVAEEGNPPLRQHICLGHIGWINDIDLKDWQLVTEREQYDI